MSLGIKIPDSYSYILSFHHSKNSFLCIIDIRWHWHKRRNYLNITHIYLFPYYYSILEGIFLNISFRKDIWPVYTVGIYFINTMHKNHHNFSYIINCLYRSKILQMAKCTVFCFYTPNSFPCKGCIHYFKHLRKTIWDTHLCIYY